jgi:hypothetical protein
MLKLFEGEALYVRGAVDSIEDSRHGSPVNFVRKTTKE